MLTIADRRNVTSWTLVHPAFKAALLAEPRSALEQVTGKSFPDDTRFELLHESEGDWCVVLPSPELIEPDLPEPHDLRSAIENGALALYRQDPNLAEAAERDPAAFLSQRLGFDLGDGTLRIHREAPGSVAILVPDYAAHEELPDSMLDMVAGGGNVPCQSDMPGKEDFAKRGQNQDVN